MDDVVGESYVEQVAKLFKILGDANRLRVLLVIGKDERSVSEIIETTSLSQTLVSFHLRALRDAGIVKAERQGAFIYYQLDKADLLDLVSEFQRYTIKETVETEKMEFPCPCPPMSKKFFNK